MQMKIVRFLAHGKARYGVIEGENIKGLKGTPYAKDLNFFKFTGDVFKLGSVTLLSPCAPSKVVCLGLNYHSHALEVKAPLPVEPLIFLKPSTAVIGSGENIVLPRSSKHVDYEGEFGVVISKKAKDVPEEKANDYIFGYVCVNDVSERYFQKNDGQWSRAKGFDTFAPIGPWIVTGISANDLKIETFLNGELRQSSRTSDLIFGVPKLINFISSVMTLLPGDVISTGTPSGVGQIKSGDVVEVCIEKIGTLKNSVVAAA